jgi:N6-L-threonylcarbamoyladenine synthase
MQVLGIETSCDETAAAVVGESGVLSDVVHTQQVHARFGGVVPELAARAHAEKLPPTVAAALAEAGIDRPDAVAATAGPGLIGALLVGFSWAKAAALAWGVPFVAVNHLEGHLLSPLLEPDPPPFPFLALVMSGGHTTLYRCDGPGRYAVLGETVDDAAGEAFDKVGRLLGLGWPGGPAVDALADRGDPAAIALPRPLPGDLDFSFAGLKTAVRTHVARGDRASDADVCASFRAAVVDCLMRRVTDAVASTGITTVAVAGGVAANRLLRERLAALDARVIVPPRSRCTDNASMIAFAGRLRLLRGERDPLSFTARPSWPIGA